VVAVGSRSVPKVYFPRWLFVSVFVCLFLFLWVFILPRKSSDKKKEKREEKKIINFNSTGNLQVC